MLNDNEKPHQAEITVVVTDDEWRVIVSNDNSDEIKAFWREDGALDYVASRKDELRVARVSTIFDVA